MSDASHSPIALNGHPSSACEAVRALHVTASAFEGRLVLSYTLDAELNRLRIPAEAAPKRAHGLWRHTCFEAFLTQKGAGGYCELNFAPSCAWAMYQFSAHREGMRVLTDAAPPEITVRRSASELTLTATLFVAECIPGPPPLQVRMGLAAVLEDEDGRLSYWAARHPPGKPDFHHPDNFTLELGV
jgi:hypothetical protein